MRKLKLLFTALALLMGASSVNAQTEDGTDRTSVINNAAVTSTTGWTNGRTASGQQYTGAPDDTYMDDWAGSSKIFDQYQKVSLPVGSYLLKCATRASDNIDENPNIYVYKEGGNVGSTTIHKEGNTGNLLGNGWGWTYVPFTLTEAAEVQIGFWAHVNNTWAGADDFHLTYYTSELAMKQAQLAAVVADANTWAGKIETTPALETALSASAPTCETVDACNTAITNVLTTITNARAAVSPYATFKALKTGAQAIANVEYTETTTGSHSTFVSALAASVDEATTAEAINTAIDNLESAIKTYIAGAEPKNDGEYFDITCLMINPNFEDSYNGWTYLSAPGVNWSNCEYYQSEFDINQTVTGLPTGSYSLNVQAFQRPGWSADVYNAYIGGTDNATSVLYINSITSKVKNIAADAQETGKLGDDSNWGTWPNDSRVGTEGNYKYLPNSQQGASLYFGAGLYDATCAAVVTEDDGGSLKLGFKSTQNHVSGDWTIFDNFRLRYYGSSLLVYYKQYLPQLKTEAGADIENGAYANVVGVEKSNFQTALAANPAAETEEAYKAVIDDILAKQTAFRNAKTSYDNLATAKATDLITKYSANVGTNPFQYNETTNNSLYSACETAKNNVDNYTTSSESTAAAVQALVDALNTAISNYQNQALNVPDAEKRYNVSIVQDDKDWNGNAITFIAGGRNDQGNYAIKYLATANANLNQALKFTAVDGETNTYKVSAINASTGAELYLTTGKTYGDGNSYEQIRVTDDASKATWIKIAATTTDGQFQLLNVSASNKVIANNNNDDMYTANTANFTIAEAAQATVNVTIAADVKYGTRIFPFAPTLPTGVKAYSCEAAVGSTLTLVEVATPAANVPYILEAESGCTSTDLQGWGVAGAISVTAGWLTGVYQDTPAPVGSYVLQKLNEKVCFYKNTANDICTVGPNHCYLTVPPASERAFYFSENGTTAVKAINALTSGKAEIFNASGAQIPALKKGMNIIRTQDGKIQKVLVK